MAGMENKMPRIMEKYLPKFMEKYLPVTQVRSLILFLNFATDFACGFALN